MFDVHLRGIRVNTIVLIIRINKLPKTVSSASRCPGYASEWSRMRFPASRRWTALDALDALDALHRLSRRFATQNDTHSLGCEVGFQLALDALDALDGRFGEIFGTGMVRQ